MSRMSTRFATLLVCFLTSGLSVQAEQPQIEIQTGHTDGVRSVAFSPDGKLLASAGIDATVIVWELQTHRQLRVFRGDVYEIHQIAFSPDGKLLAAANAAEGSSDDLAALVTIWDVETGRIVHELKGRPYDVRSLAFSPDGKTLAVGGTQNLPLRLWSVSTGRSVRELPSDDATLGHVAVAFTPDGKTLAALSSENVHLWNVSAGTSVRTLDATNGQSMAISPDGKIIAVGNLLSSPSFFDTATGAALPAIDCEYCTTLSFSADGKRLAANRGGAVRLWDLETKAEVFRSPMVFRNLHTQENVTDLAISPDGRLIAACGEEDSSVALLDVMQNDPAQSLSLLEGGRDLITSLAISPTGKTVAVNSNRRSDQPNLVKIWDAASGQMRSRIMPALEGGKGETGRPLGLTFSPDGRLLAYHVQVRYGSSRPAYEVRLVDANGQDVAALGCTFSEPTLAFSPDGAFLAGTGVPQGDQPRSIAVWDVASRQPVRSIAVTAPVSELRFGKDRTTLYGEIDGSAITWSVETGNVVNSRKLPEVEGGRIPAAWLTPDGKTAFASPSEHELVLVDPSTRRVLHRLNGHTATFYGAASLSRDGKQLITGAWDSKTIIWDVSSGEQIATLLTFGETDWLVITPDGLFDGSPAAWNKVLWRFSTSLRDVTPVELFFSDFYSPGLLTGILRGEHPTAPESITQKDRRQPQVTISSDASSGEPRTAAAVEATIRVTNAPAGAQDVRLFRNGSLVKVWHGDVLEGSPEKTLTARIPMIAGANQLTAYAFNRDNVKSADSTILLSGAESLRRKGIAHVLAIGVNTYANREFDLKYAVPDAEDFGAEWRAQQAKLQLFESTELVTLADAAATKQNILRALADISSKVKPEDALVIYFAGHGTAQANRFYLIPHDLGYAGGRDSMDEAGLTTLLAHSISDAELQSALEGVDAAQLLMVIDACNSGQVLESEEKRRGPMNSKGLAQLAYEKGMYILTAAQSYQAAQEAAKFGHGFLTFALVEEGLKQGKADDQPRDGSVVVREWFDFATQRVPQLQMELMQETAGRGVKVAFVKGEESIADPAQRNLQRPRVFYRREQEARPLVVARP
ncbi:MAG: hypothetical protein QOC81_85 [Thermoanaerobaculia bacterium]|nr:hypothetical protein [Thermoanaerobaculia bacterium]